MKKQEDTERGRREYIYTQRHKVVKREGDRKMKTQIQRYINTERKRDTNRERNCERNTESKRKS